jgi:hypothetical protein
MRSAGARTLEHVEADQQKDSNLIMLYAALAATTAYTTRSLRAVVLRSDVYTVREGVVSGPTKGEALRPLDPSAHILCDSALATEVLLPLVCGGVIYTANFSMVYIAVAVLALAVGAVNYGVSEGAVTLSGVHNIRISDAISQWSGKAGDKPGLDVMSGFLQSQCLVSAGPLLAFTKAAFLAYRGSFLFLFRVLVANAVLCATVIAMSFGLSRVLNASALRRRRRRVGSFTRRVDGRLYVRRQALVYLASMLPSVSVALAVALPLLKRALEA